jgi:hypothetical protein
VTNEPKVLYEALQPGKYIFEVQAGLNGVWLNKSIKINFTIIPPFYKSWWFILIFILTIITCIYLFFKFRIIIFNKHLSREILRQLLKRLKKKSPYFVVKTDGRTLKINSRDVLYITAHRNYIEITTSNQRIIMREKISNILKLVPDPIEFVQINRSTIIRIDCITAKSKTSIQVDKQEFKIGSTFYDVINEIQI